MTLLGPSRAEGAVPTAVIAGFSCSLLGPSQHAVAYTPAEVQGAFVACFPCTARLPHWSAGSSSASTFSRPHRAFTHVTACRFAKSPKVTLSSKASTSLFPPLPLRSLLGKATIPRRDFHPLNQTSSTTHGPDLSIPFGDHKTFSLAVTVACGVTCVAAENPRLNNPCTTSLTHLPGFALSVHTYPKRRIVRVATDQPP
jgi:hypothetical protein